MKRILVALLLLIWGVVSGPAQAFAEDGSVEPRILIMRQCGDISFSKGGCVYAEDDGSFRGVVEFRTPLTPAQRKARAEAAQARKQRERDMEQRIAMLESRLAASWTTSSATMPYSPMLSLAAPVASASTAAEPSAAPTPDTMTQRITELEAQVKQLMGERETLQRQLSIRQAFAHQISVPLWFKVVLFMFALLTLANSVMLAVIMKIALEAKNILVSLIALRDAVVASLGRMRAWPAGVKTWVVAHWPFGRAKRPANGSLGLDDERRTRRPETGPEPEEVERVDEAELRPRDPEPARPGTVSL